MADDKHGMTWFRTYSEVLSDIKFKRIARLTGQPVATIIGVWTIMLCLASDSPTRGALLFSDGTPVTNEDIADMAGCDVTVTSHVTSQMSLVTTENGVMFISNWDKRQFETDSSRSRMRRMRERQKSAKNQAESQVCDVTGPSQDRHSDNAVTPYRVQSTDLTTTSNDVVGSAEPSPVMAGQDPKTTPTPAPDPAPTSQITKSSRTVVNPTAQQLMIGAVADVCMIDLKLKSGAGRAGKAAAELLAAGYTATQVTAFKDWWYACDWRGQRGDTPTPARIIEKIKESLTPRPDIVRSNGNTRPERSSNHGSNPHRPQNGSAANGVVGSIDEYIADLPAEWR